MRNYQKMNLKFSIFFIVVCLLFSASYFIMDWQWLTTANYRLHEMTGLAISLGYFLIPVSVIAGLIIYFQYHRKTDKTAKKPLNMLFNTLSIVSLFLCVLTFSYFSGRISTSGVEQSLSKLKTDSGYFVTLNNTQIKVSEQQYKALNDGAAYLYSYYQGEWIGGKYSKLEYINAFEEYK
ncbi:MAG: hypothetical protein LBH86_01695 [Oscillospiraceae bacterium]|jgi:amino acid transporter|nr:hypothetical protein [Oscillospiraceae bacterium]